MSLLTICQNVIAEVGFGSRPSSIVGNSDALAQQCLVLAKRSIQDISSQHDWANNTVYGLLVSGDGSDVYELNSQIKYIVGDSIWDATNQRKVKYVAPEVFAAIENTAGGGTLTPRTFTLNNTGASGKSFWFNEAVASGTSIYGFYHVDQSVLNADALSGHENFETDADTVRAFSEHLVELNLKWRLKRAKGFAYDEERDEYDRQLAIEIARDKPVTNINFSMMNSGLSMPNLPSTIPEPV